MWCIMSPKNLITRFCKDEAASISIEWVVITAGVIALGVGAYGAFSVRPDKFDETEMRTLVRYKMEQYGAISGDDYTIIERMLYSVRLQVTAFKGCIGFGVESGKEQNGNDVVLGQRPTDYFCRWVDL